MPTFRAVESAAVTFDGVTYHLNPGSDLRDDDPFWGPLIAARPDLFGRFVPVEQATAAPGERRNVKRTTRG